MSGVAGHFDLFAGQDIDAAPEDDLGSDLRVHRSGDLLKQEARCRTVEGPETLEGQYRGLGSLRQAGQGWPDDAAGCEADSQQSPLLEVRALAVAPHVRHPAGGKPAPKRIALRL